MSEHTTCPRCGHKYAKVPLTTMQRSVYDYIVGYIDDNRVAPTYQTIADHYNYRSLGTVSEHLRNLERKGWIVLPRKYAQQALVIVA